MRFLGELCKTDGAGTRILAPFEMVSQFLSLSVHKRRTESTAKCTGDDIKSDSWLVAGYRQRQYLCSVLLLDLFMMSQPENQEIDSHAGIWCWSSIPAWRWWPVSIQLRRQDTQGEGKCRVYKLTEVNKKTGASKGKQPWDGPTSHTQGSELGKYTAGSINTLELIKKKTRVSAETKRNIQTHAGVHQLWTLFSLCSLLKSLELHHFLHLITCLSIINERRLIESIFYILAGCYLLFCVLKPAHIINNLMG